MGLILSIETATKVCSVALHEDEEMLGSQELHVDRSHSEYLALMIGIHHGLEDRINVAYMADS